MATVLCVDDSRADLESIALALEEGGHDVIRAEHVPQALAMMEEEDPDLIVSDYRLPKVSGLEFLRILQRTNPNTPLIMSTAYATVEDAVSALKAGAIDYVTKPVEGDRLRFAVDQALELTSLRRENVALRGEVSELKLKRQILGDSAPLREALDIVKSVAPTRATVLIEGESGTGKELFARAIHDLSDRSTGPFVAVNCAAIPEQLIESSLFGHEKGAFTGANSRVAGAFERAHGGTLLLDEISEMQVDLQAKLLRALQEQEFERVGGTSLVRVDVRVIATTNRDLAEHVRQGAFREDLFFRLAVVPLPIPPLRERPDDVLLLANAFARRAAENYGKEVNGISADAAALLREYAWPGNVRELEHAIERAVIMTSDSVLRPADVSLAGKSLCDGLESRAPAPGSSLPYSRSQSRTARLAEWDLEAVDASLEDDESPQVVLRSLDVRAAEELLIQEALRRTDGNRTQASGLLGINPRTLRNKLNGR